jgi:hypothetical protein
MITERIIIFAIGIIIIGLIVSKMITSNKKYISAIKIKNHNIFVRHKQNKRKENIAFYLFGFFIFLLIMGMLP